MKAYYCFKNVSTDADVITLRAYGVDIMQFRKEDYNGDFKNIENKEFELSPFDCVDFDKLSVKGEEIHPGAEYPELLRNKWYEITRNLLRNDFFKNKERLAEIDTEKPVILVSKTKIKNAKDLKEFATDIPKEYKLDLSQLITEDLENTEGYDGYKVGSTIYRIPDALSGCKGQIVKYFNFPSNIANLTSFFAGYSSLYEIPNLTDGDITLPKVTSVTNLFTGTKIENIGNIPLPECISFERTFYNCKNLKSIGNINLPKCTSIGDAFTGCSQLEKIGDIIAPNATDLSLPKANTTVGNINVKTINKISANNIGELTFNRISSGDTTYGIIESKYIEGVSSDVSTRGYNLFKIQSELSIGFLYLPNYIGNLGYRDTSSDVISYLGPAYLNPEVTGYYDSFYKRLRVMKAVALPCSYCPKAFTLSNSEGFDQWVDYYSQPSKYIRNITESSVNFTYSINSTKNDIIEDMPIDISKNLLKVADDYPYSITIDEISILDSITVSNLKNCKNVKFITENNCYSIHIEIDDATDNTIATFTIRIPIVYTATIEGHLFKGQTYTTINGSVSTTIDEEIPLSIRIVDDEEDTASDS